MKKFSKISVCIALFNLSYLLNAQIAIGKTSVTNNSVLLEFGPGNKGIILPAVPSITANNSGGTFVFNTTTKSVQVWEQRNNNGSGEWLNLTELNAGIPHAFTNAGSDNNTNAGVIMGSGTSSKSGTLVLESTSRALVLPIVQNPHVTMVGCVAGTIVYDSTSSTLAVYDGANWNYWK